MKVYKPKSNLTDSQKIKLLWKVFSRDTHIVIDDTVYKELTTSEKSDIEEAKK